MNNKLKVQKINGSLYISEETPGKDVQGREGIHVEHWATIPESWLQTDAVKEERAKLLSLALQMRAALQWLLDDMTDAGESESESGVTFDSVAEARRVLVEAGGSAMPVIAA